MTSANNSLSSVLILLAVAVLVVAADVGAVLVEDQEAGGWWLRGTDRPTVAQGVLLSIDRGPVELPGFRAVLWETAGEPDRHNTTDLKIGVVSRYRVALRGPWPEHDDQTT